MEVGIRPAIIEDYEQVAEIYREVSELHAEIHPELFKKIKDFVIPSGEFAEILVKKDSIVCVATLNQKIVAFLIADIRSNFDKDKKTMHISKLGVSSKYKHHGIGHKLFEYLEQIAKEQSCSSIELNVFYKNEVAKKFYKSLGFGVQRLTLEKPIK